MKRLLACVVLFALAAGCGSAMQQQSTETPAQANKPQKCDKQDEAVRAEKDAKRRYELIKQLSPECV